MKFSFAVLLTAVSRALARDTPNLRSSNRDLRVNKIDVCHYSASTESYSLISIAEPAYDSHVAHGDALIGGAVPTMPGYQFNDNCEPVMT